MIDIITTTTAFTCFNAKRKKHSFITININNFWSYFTFLAVHWNTFQRVYINYNQKIIVEEKVSFFSSNACECLKYHQHQFHHNQHLSHELPLNPVFFHATCWIIFWNIPQAEVIWNNLRICCCKFMNFCTIIKQLTVCSIIMQPQTKFCVNFGKIDRIRFFSR